MLRRSYRLLENMPRFVRDPFIRSQLRLSYEAYDDIEIKIAETKEELEQAFAILHDAYLETDLIQREESGIRVTKYHSLPSTVTIIVKKNGEVAGTVSLIMDSPFGLPIDQTTDISSIRANSARVAEVSSLAVKKDSGLRRGRILIPLTTFLHYYAEHIAGVDALVCVVNKSAKLFYEGIMLFESIKADNIDYSFVNAKEICPLVLRVGDEHRDRIEKLYRKKPAEKNLHLYRYGGKQPSCWKMPKYQYRIAGATQITTEKIEHFFKVKTRLFDTFSQKEIDILGHTYVHPYITKLLPKTGEKEILRKNIRYPVNCDAKFASISRPEIVIGKIIEASNNGFAFHSTTALKINDSFIMETEISKGVKVKMQANIIWANEKSNKYGALIQNIPAEWTGFQQYLQDFYYPDISALNAKAIQAKESMFSHRVS